MTSTLSFYDHDTNSTLLAIGDDIPSIWNPYKVFNVAQYGARGTGTTDDTAAIARAIAAAVAYGNPAQIYFPKGIYLVQDPTPNPHAAVGDGVIRIPIGASISLYGPSAKILLGPNGASTSVIRIFGRRCTVQIAEIDLNGTVPVTSKNNVAIQINASGFGEADVDGCDNVVHHCYIHNSRYLLEYSTGTIAYDHTGGTFERMVTLTGGSFPTLLATNGAIQIAGTWYTIAAWVNGTTLQLNSGAGNNPGADVAGGTSYVANADPYQTQGHDGIQVLNGARNHIRYNKVFEIGWSAIRSNGDGNVIYGNTLKQFRGNGIRLADGDWCLVEKNWISSTHCSGRSCLLADAGSGPDLTPENNAGVRISTLTIRDNYSYCNSNGNFEGAGSAMKLGAVRNCIVDGGEYIAGTATNNTAIRIEDCIRKVTFMGGLRCFGPFQQTNNALTASLVAVTSSATGTYTGKAQLQINGHGQVAGKSIWLMNCPIAAWDDQEFIVLEVVNANNIVVGRITGADGTVTAEPYNASSITGTVVHAGVHEVVIKDCFIERGTHDENNFTRHITAPWVTISDCVFEQVEFRTDGTVKESGLLFDYPSDAYIKRLRIVRNEFRFNTSALCRAIRSTNDDPAGSAATTFITAGKFICYGNRLENKSTGTVELVQRYESGDVTASYDDRLIIFSTEGENPNAFSSPALPAESWVSWTRGQTIRNTAPSAAGAPGWSCITTAVGGSSLFKAQAVLAS
jgi:hypothetical protein